VPLSRDLRHTIIAFVTVGVALAALVRVDVEIRYVGHLGSALVAIMLLYAPLFWAWRRNEDLVTYGLRAEPVGRGLALGLGLPLFVVFPLFLGGYLLFYEIACGSPTLAVLTPPGACLGFGGWTDIGAPHLDADLAVWALGQLVVVALPEELFFRGFLLHLLERAFPPRRRLWGGGIGWALFISAALFAVIHLPRDGDPRALATFFPGLLFGWMRSATGSILAPTLAHAGSNIFIRILDSMVLR
jgi:uncharacterized protein